LHEFDTQNSVPPICTLAIEKKCSKPHLCDMTDEGRNEGFSEMKTNEFLSYIGDKIWLKCFAYLVEILKNWIT